jgi:hypothetical protein
MAAKVQRVQDWPSARGSRPIIWRSSWLASSVVAWRGGKSGLAPAPALDEQPSDAIGEKAINPELDGFAAARFENAGSRNLPNRPTISNAENSSGPFAHIGLEMMVACVGQRGTLGIGQMKFQGSWHGLPSFLLVSVEEGYSVRVNL